MTGSDACVACALLAAGSARRFGDEKLLARLGKRAVWQWSARSAERVGFDALFLVTRPDLARRLARPGWTVVENPEHREGLASSIRRAVASVHGADRLVVMLADMPRIPHGLLARLAAAEGVAFTRYPDGSRGCPAAFPRDAFDALQDLRGDRGAASGPFDGAVAIEPEDPAMLQDIDRRSDLDDAEPSRSSF